MITAYIINGLFFLFGAVSIGAGVKTRKNRTKAALTWPRSAGKFIKNKKEASLDFETPYIEYEWRGEKYCLLNHFSAPDDIFKKGEITVIVNPENQGKSFALVPSKYMNFAPLAMILTGIIFLATTSLVYSLMIFVM